MKGTEVFDKDGVLVTPGFLSPEDVDAINKELDQLSEIPSVNGNLATAMIRPGYKQVMAPCLQIRSVNLLEVALKIRDLLNSRSATFKSKKYRLKEVEIYLEQDNPERLFWHTDERFGMVRAQIYLRGGQPDSGAFQYMRGSHRRDYYVVHKISTERERELASTIQDCVAPTGALVAFDAFGFHAKTECFKERRTIMFEFQSVEENYGPSKTIFSSDNLTPAVLANLDFLLPDSTPRSARSAAIFSLEKVSPLPFWQAVGVLQKSLKWTKTLFFTKASYIVKKVFGFSKPTHEVHPPVDEVASRAGYKEWKSSLSL